MSEMKDTGIKLFGKIVQLGMNINKEGTEMASRVEPRIAAHTARHDGHEDNGDDDDCDCGCDCECTSCDHSSKQDENRGIEKASTETRLDIKQETEPSWSSVLEESDTLPSDSTISKKPKTNSHDKECSSQDISNKEYLSDQASTNNSDDQNPPKKPDKIPPCPRCSSMATKFCYFNNYNVNQPRHFCKNCQRYWTAGGTMRNVPVGAGRRKSKSTGHCNLAIPEVSYGHARRSNGSVFVFGQASSHSESRASMKSTGFLRPEVRSQALNGSLEDGKENKNANSISMDKGGSGICQGVPPQMTCYQRSSWPNTWNPMSWQSGYPVSFCSTPPQWVCNSAGNWKVQSQSIVDQTSATSSPYTPSPRKHSRDGTILFLRPSKSDNEEQTEVNNPEIPRVVVQRTSRFDDPIEAASSSMWTTLRVKNNHISSSNGKGGFFEGIEQLNGTGRARSDPSAELSSMVMQVNPAAFSRYLSFHEIAR